MIELNEWILISVFILAAVVVLGLILTFVLYKKKKEGKMGTPNYQVFFMLGIMWMPIGIVFMMTVNVVIGIAFLGLGASYLAIGLANRNKWNKQ